ncbi:hypothetical protein LCGC14_0363490 [marine sediment metagenome]|uniref:Uncharacterized protein n=1 Tax=marine sediment metagenome TaxID=412755 RepID=A0A0F9TQB8_9ZZZZ
MIPDGEVGCKICNKSIYRIFVEHVQGHLDKGGMVGAKELKRMAVLQLKDLAKEYSTHHAGSKMDELSAKISVIKNRFNISDEEYAKIYHDAVNEI